MLRLQPTKRTLVQDAALVQMYEVDREWDQTPLLLSDGSAGNAMFEMTPSTRLPGEGALLLRSITNQEIWRSH